MQQRDSLEENLENQDHRRKDSQEKGRKSKSNSVTNLKIQKTSTLPSTTRTRLQSQSCCEPIFWAISVHVPWGQAHCRRLTDILSAEALLQNLPPKGCWLKDA